MITGSGNYTASAMSAQPNDFLQLRVPSVTTRFEEQMYEFVKGANFHDNTASGGNYLFYSPNGDTVEVYFNPDDANNIATGDGDGLGDDGTCPIATHPAEPTIHGVILNHVARAKQSVFYQFAGFTLSDEFDSSNLEYHFKQLTPSKLVEGSWESLDNSPAGAMATRLQADHESRDGGAAYASPYHAKYMVIDQEKIITGSANYTFGATGSSTGSDENKVVVHDFRLARKYLAYYRYILANFVTTADGVGTNTFETTKPAGVTGFTVAATDTAFYPSWTADATADVTRYFIFIDTVVIDTKAIGNGVDDDVDGNIDEDPKNNADNFSSGTTEGSATANDDDADGSDDEDPWMWPEIQVKGKTSTSGAVRSYNVGDSLKAGVNYYFAIVSVDTHGNEAGIDTYGPIQLASAVDTRLQVVKNSDVADTNGSRGAMSIIALNVWIQGETGALQDTLAKFAVKNLGLADSLDLTVRLWRDEDADSRISAADTMVSQLVYSPATGRFETTFAASNIKVRLGSTGKTFLVTLDIFDTATLGDTFQAQVDARTCSSPRRDSGPTASVANTGKVTVVSVNPVDVTLRGDYTSANVAKGTSNQPVMTATFSVVTPNDVLQVFGVSNDGTMTSSDISEIRIYHDGNSDSAIDASPTDTLIGYMRNVSGAVWRADTCAYSFGGTTVPLILSISVSGGATGGRTFQGRILANSADAVTADTGPTTDRVTSALFTVPSDTSPDTAIVVNEFYSSPNTTAPPNHDNDGATGGADEEYIELYNNSDGSVDIGNWDVSDNSSGAVDITLPAGLVMGARQFLIIYPDTPATEPQWRRMDSAGAVVLDSGRYTGTFPGINNNADSFRLCNAANTETSFTPVGGGFAFSSSQRLPDGSSDWFRTTNSPGINDDPSTFDTYSPNTIFLVTTDSDLPPEGLNFGLTMTMRTRGNQTCSTFAGTGATLSVSAGSISPTTTGTFTAGIRQDSFMITGTSGVCTISVRYNVTTVGYCTVNIQPPPPPDTKIIVSINSHVGDTSSPRGTDTAILLRVRVRGETTGTGDTLVNFVCENLGLADELDAYLQLWRDNDNDSQWTTADSRVATLSRSGAFWSASNLSTVTSAYLGSGGSAGRNFLVIANTYDTATLNDTFQFKINALSFDASVGDSGPVSGFTNSGIFTIVSANQVTVVLRGDTLSETIALGDTKVAMGLTLGVTLANDTITGFGVTNLGTLGNSDITAVRLWHDHSSDSLITSADTLIATLPFVGAATWRNTSISYPFTGTSIPLVVTVQVSGTAAGLSTFRGQITANEAGTTRGDSGPTASLSTTATFTTPSDTVADTFVVINEFIMDPGSPIDHDFDGNTGDADEEYVELFNSGSGTVDVSGWKIDDDQYVGDEISLNGTIFLGPKQFLIVYAATDSQGRSWYRYASDGITLMDSGTYTGTYDQMNNAVGDSIRLSTAGNVFVDSFAYTDLSVNKAHARQIDGRGGVGALTAVMNPTPGKNQDPTAQYNKPSPNAHCTVAVSALHVINGESFNITVAVLDANESTIASFTDTVIFSPSNGTISPASSGAFVSGVRNDSISCFVKRNVCKT